MGIFGKSKKEREKEYMNKLDVKSCLKENFELIIDDVFTIIGVGTVATGYILTGMCRVGEDVSIYVANGDVLKTTITTVDAHTKERKSNDCGYKTDTGRPPTTAYFPRCFAAHHFARRRY